MIRILILTSDKTAWALRGWFHLADKYWPQHPPVIVGGYTPLEVPAGVEFISLGAFSDYPVNKWSNALKRLLERIPDEFILWTMDDFWPIAPVDQSAVDILGAYLERHEHIARIDLTADRVFAHGAKEAGTLGRLHLVTNELPVPYLFSLQTGLWRKSALQAYLVDDETPWQVELEGTSRMYAAGANVYGTREAPVKNLIAVQQGKVTLDGGYQGKEYALPPEDFYELHALGALTP